MQSLDNDNSIKTLKGASSTSHYILWVSAVFLVLIIIWAKFAVLDEVSKGEGKVIPSSQVQVIQNLEGGIIKEILVHEGQVVAKGETLMTIDDTQFASSLQESLVKLKMLETKLTILMAEAEESTPTFDAKLQQDFPNIVKNEMNLYQSRQDQLQSLLAVLDSQTQQKKNLLAELTAKQDRLASSVQLIKKELSLTEPLLAEGVVSEVEIIRLQRQANNLDGEYKETSIAMQRAELAVKESLSKIQETKLSFKSESLTTLNSAKIEMSILIENRKTLADRVDRTVVTSPVDGTIKQIFINTIGGVIAPGMELIEIVPLNDTLLIEAFVKPADIAFIHPGQEAIVKITAYDFSIYGGLPAILEHISADTVRPDGQNNQQDLYEIHVRTKNSLYDKQGNLLPIIPGMQASVDVLTGQKSVLDYILKPILKTKQEALRER